MVVLSDCRQTLTFLLCIISLLVECDTSSSSDDHDDRPDEDPPELSVTVLGQGHVCVDTLGLARVDSTVDSLNTGGEHMFYRLPTEAEWECSCRAGRTTAYYYGSDVERLAIIEPNQRTQGGFDVSSRVASCPGKCDSEVIYHAPLVC